MRHKIVSVSQAKAKLLEFARRADEEGRSYLLTKDGVPLVALVPMETYEAFLESSDVLADPTTLVNLKQALKDERAGRLWKRDRNGRWTKARTAKQKPKSKSAA